MKIADFKNKRIAIVGYGVEGQSTARYLSRHNIDFDILDRAKEKDFFSNHEMLKEFKGEYHLGDNYLERLGQYQIAFKSPGIPLRTTEIKKALDKGIVVTSQIEYFYANQKSLTIGVTGTKGKGTTVSLIYEILKNDEKEVFLGGNIGTPVLDFIDDLSERSIVVLELSSYQLQELQVSPNIAVVLNITSDHLDYHSNTAEYRKAKEAIVKYQGKNDFATINFDYIASKKFAELGKGKKYYFSRYQRVTGCYVDTDDQLVISIDDDTPTIIAKVSELLLRGRHNLENVTAASLASFLVGARTEKISGTIKSFKGLEHRLELVVEKNGIKYYNDSFSTVPETAIAAIDSFDEKIVLICGGSDKGSDYRELGKKIADSKVNTVILIGEMAPKIRAAIPEEYHGQLILGLTSMETIVERAKKEVKKDGVVLLSPACASFGLFKNYKDRGNRFKEAVKILLDK